MLTLISVTAAEVFTDIGYVIVSILALMVMIVLHELGHYSAAKLLKFKVDEFGVGMGPILYKKTNRKSGEVFTLRMLPLGGFCAFHENEEDPSDPMSFNNQKPWKRLIVLVSGALMNLLSAIFLITIFFSAYGQMLPAVNHVPDVAYGDSSMLQEDDIILRVNGKQVNCMDNTDFFKVIKSMGTSCTVKVLRNGEIVEVHPSVQYYNIFNAGDTIIKINDIELETPIDPVTNLNGITEFVESKEELKDLENINVVIKYVIDEENFGTYTVKLYKGNPLDVNNFYAYDYGIHQIRFTKLPFFVAFGRAWGYCFFIVFKILASLGMLITGQIGIENAGGTLTIIGTMAEISSMGFANFLQVTAIISANLGVMNLLPLPALDGSRIVFTLIEMIFRKPVPRKVEGAIHAVGLILLLTLTVFLDVFHLAHI